MPDLTQPEYGLGGRILVIYGSNPDSTLRTVTVLDVRNKIKNWYDFDNAQNGDGDGVVPVDSATLKGVPALEIPKADVSVFNVKSHLFSLHALLPSLDEVSSATSRFFSGKTGTDLVAKGADWSLFHP
jgi:hypothetical protein